MHVFNIPASAPFLHTLIEALVDGRLIDGFAARANPESLASATLYLPTRRAGRLAREVFLDVLKLDAAVLPRIVTLGDIDEDRIQARFRNGVLTVTAPKSEQSQSRVKRIPINAGATSH